MNSKIIYWLLIFLELASITNGHEISNFDVARYEKSIEFARRYSEEDILSIIAPHHLLASDLIANIYSTSSNNDVEYILLLSPDHNSNSERKVLTSTKNWIGSYGSVYVNQGKINFFLDLDFVYEDHLEVEKEHGINVHIPYIAHYFKNAQIIPLAISNTLTIDELNQILDLIDENTFVIASVDFSHYLSLDESNKRDDVTKNIILNRDYNMLLSKGDEYFDSSGVLYLILNYIEKMNYKTVFLDHSNSAKYLGDNIFETTSYFIIGFTK